MAQAIMDPDEVRRFASELKRFNEDVQTAGLRAAGEVCRAGFDLAGPGPRKVRRGIYHHHESPAQIHGSSEKHTPLPAEKSGADRAVPRPTLEAHHGDATQAKVTSTRCARIVSGQPDRFPDQGAPLSRRRRATRSAGRANGCNTTSGRIGKASCAGAPSSWNRRSRN